MSYRYELEKKKGYLLLTASGSIDSLDDLEALSKALGKESLQWDSRRFLVDERAVVKSIDPYELTVFAESKMDRPTRLRVAIICLPEDISNLRWIETIHQNRSLAYRQFSSFDEAEKWLTTPDHSK